MKYQVGDIVQGEVTGIQSYGAFIKLLNGEQGLIHISEISSYFVKNINTYVQLGQIIKVKIIDILVEKQLYRLSLKQVQPTPRQNVRKANNLNKKRFKVPFYQQDFTPLADNLDEWIAQGLDKYSSWR
jgi:predicted RNA-binding protein with RPS1 domain